MADFGQRTEQPTQRRLDRARREGNFPSSRDFVSSIHFLGFAVIVAWLGGGFVLRVARLMRALLILAFAPDLTTVGAMKIAQTIMAPELFRLAVSGAAILLVAILAQFAATRMGISFQKLAPDPKRLNPLKQLASLPSQNIFHLAQAIVLLIVVGVAVHQEISENLNPFLELPWLAPGTAAMRVGGTLRTLLWRATGVFLLTGIVDLSWNRWRYTRQLRMTKQEVREEVKEQESSPQVKMRIRRIQRDLARRQMMKELPKATAVIVNPTHYSVAIRYSIETPGAPRIVAKGKNYLAKRIRQLALEHQVPIVENPPLARALYTSVEVGQEIPSHLYRAVAEILAYIYKLMNGRLPS